MFIITFPSKLFHSGAQPPFGIRVGATVELTGGDSLRLQTKLYSSPQLTVSQSPVTVKTLLYQMYQQ